MARTPFRPAATRPHRKTRSTDAVPSPSSQRGVPREVFFSGLPRRPILRVVWRAWQRQPRDRSGGGGRRASTAGWNYRRWLPRCRVDTPRNVCRTPFSWLWRLLTVWMWSGPRTRDRARFIASCRILSAPRPPARPVAVRDQEGVPRHPGVKVAGQGLAEAFGNTRLWVVPVRPAAIKTGAYSEETPGFDAVPPRFRGGRPKLREPLCLLGRWVSSASMIPLSVSGVSATAFRKRWRQRNGCLDTAGGSAGRRARRSRNACPAGRVQWRLCRFSPVRKRGANGW